MKDASGARETVRSGPECKGKTRVSVGGGESSPQEAGTVDCLTLCIKAENPDSRTSSQQWDMTGKIVRPLSLPLHEK